LGVVTSASINARQTYTHSYACDPAVMGLVLRVELDESWYRGWPNVPIWPQQGHLYHYFGHDAGDYWMLKYHSGRPRAILPLWTPGYLITTLQSAEPGERILIKLPRPDGIDLSRVTLVEELGAYELWEITDPARGGQS